MFLRNVLAKAAAIFLLTHSVALLFVPAQTLATALPPDWHIPGYGDHHYSSTIVSPALSGHVFNDDGTAYHSANAGLVEALRQGVVVASSRIDSGNSGSYDLRIAPGVYDIKFVAGADDPFAESLVHNVDTTATHTLDGAFVRSTHQVSGTVVGANNQGLSSISVHFHETGTVTSSPHEYDATTDANGHYATATSGGKYIVTFSGSSLDQANGMPQQYGYTKSIDTRNSDASIDLQFSGRLLQVQLYDVNNTPIGEVPISVHVNPADVGNTGHLFDSTASTDELGHANIPLLVIPDAEESAVAFHFLINGQDNVRYYSTDLITNMSIHISDFSVPVSTGSFSVTNQNGPSVQLSWQGDANASGYIIFRDGNFLAQTASTNYVDTLASEGSYNYGVVALDGQGDMSGANRSVAIYDHTPPVLADPVAVADPIPYDSYIYDSNNHSINTSFPAIVLTTNMYDESVSTGAEYFLAGHDPGPGHATALVANPPSPVLQTPEFHLNPGQYTYGVRGRDDSGNWTGVKFITLHVVDQREPVGVAGVTPTQQPPTITWAGAPEAVSYLVSRVGATFSVNGTSFTDSGLNFGGTFTYTVRGVDAQGNLSYLGPNDSVTIEYDHTAAASLSSVSPAQVWVGLKNSDDVGVKFDLLAEVYRDSTLVTSGQLNSVAAGSSGFSNAKLNTIALNSFSPVDFVQGSQLKLVVYVRNACNGSGHNSGTARLWFNDSAATSQFGATIGNASSSYFLLDSFALGTTAGPGPKKTIDVAVGAKCSAFKPFGTWMMTPDVSGGGGSNQ